MSPNGSAPVRRACRSVDRRSACRPRGPPALTARPAQRHGQREPRASAPASCSSSPGVSSAKSVAASRSAALARHPPPRCRLRSVALAASAPARIVTPLARRGSPRRACSRAARAARWPACPLRRSHGGLACPPDDGNLPGSWSPPVRQPPKIASNTPPSVSACVPAGHQRGQRALPQRPQASPAGTSVTARANRSHRSGPDRHARPPQRRPEPRATTRSDRSPEPTRRAVAARPAEPSSTVATSSADQHPAKPASRTASQVLGVLEHGPGRPLGRRLVQLASRRAPAARPPS